MQKSHGRILTFEFPINTPGNNVLMNEHWTTTHKRNKKVKLHCLEKMYGQPLFKKARIEYTRFGRMMDEDNLYGSSKVWIDCLKQFKIIIDDSPLYVKRACFQEKGKPKTIIKVIELL